MNRSRWLYVPLAYTALTRLANVRGVLDHLTRDVAIPLIPAIAVFGVDGRVALLLWVGFAALYEVGYLINDRDATAGEDGGDRLGGASVAWLPAISVRLALFTAVTVMVGADQGWWVGATYALVSVVVLALLILHTLIFSRTASLRFFSFALLSLAKYAPFLVPLIGWSHAIPYVGSIFLMYGIPRTVHYVVRKMWTTQPTGERERFQLTAHGLGLVPGLVIVAPDLLALFDHGWSAPALLWVLYMVAWSAALAARHYRHPV